MRSFWLKKHENRLAAELLHPLGSLSAPQTPSRVQKGRETEGVARRTGLSLEGREGKTGKGEMERNGRERRKERR